MRKLLKSKKALSPVVAAIILIAVTVAVSIAVAAWMGSLTFTFMETEEMTITTAKFNTARTGINMTVLNSGTTDIILTAVTITGQGMTGSPAIVGSPQTISPTGATQAVNINVGATAVAGNSYLVELVSTKGNKYTYTVVA
jgi:flagellin-like protein